MANQLFSMGNFGKSRREIEEEQAKYEKEIFPLGDQQKQNIKDLLFQIDSKKLYQSERMIGYIEGKQSYQKNRDLNRVYKLIQDKKAMLTREQIRELIALIILDVRCDSIDKLPQLAQAKNLARSLDLPE